MKVNWLYMIKVQVFGLAPLISRAGFISSSSLALALPHFPFNLYILMNYVHVIVAFVADDILIKNVILMHFTTNDQINDTEWVCVTHKAMTRRFFFSPQCCSVEQVIWFPFWVSFNLFLSFQHRLLWICTRCILIKSFSFIMHYNIFMVWISKHLERFSAHS